MTEQLQRARPLLFGVPGRKLFGMLHPPATAASRRPSILLCSPFGQEAIQSHRTYKVLAERLARAGHAVLRFDYFGTGDSEGEDTEVTLSGWCQDINLANAQLRALTNDRPVLWLGLGLGAAAAWLTAAKSTQPPARLLLWDPVFDGRNYVATLRRRHDEAARDALSLPSRRVLPATDVIEAIGFAVAPVFAAELDALDVNKIPTLPVNIQVVLIAAADSPNSAILLAQSCNRGQALRHLDVTSGMDWMAENNDGGMLVPGPALQSLIALSGEAS